MTKLFTFLILIISCTALSQSKTEYLRQNQFDLNHPDFQFPQTDFNIIGFGAYHGSAKTYDAEIKLIASLKKQNALDYYIIETNFSQAFYFQQYLDTGDEDLLNELILCFESIVSQEGTIDTFEHWKKLRTLNQMYPNNPIKVLGFDLISEYHFPIKHLLYLTKEVLNWTMRNELETKFSSRQLDFKIRNQETKNLLQKLTDDYQTNKHRYLTQVKDTVSLNHLLKNIALSFEEKRDREKIIFDNYVALKDIYNLETKKQFAKYGFFHIQKDREQMYPSFFTRLIEQNIYHRNNVVTIMGYLTTSEVLWDKIYDDNGNYKSYTIEKGFGIGDYWKEYFKGIKKLKKTKRSDLTLFKLNNINSPYHVGSDLIEVRLFLKKSNRKALKAKPTTNFIDYAVLITNSKNQVPIEEMNMKQDIKKAPK